MDDNLDWYRRRVKKHAKKHATTSLVNSEVESGLEAPEGYEDKDLDLDITHF